MTQEPSTSARVEATWNRRDSPRLLLVDGLDAPRRALAGQLALHIGAARITESRTLAEALTAQSGPHAGTSAPAWDAVLISAGDSAEARSMIARIRADMPDLPVLVMRPGGEATESHNTPEWPAGVALLDRPVRLATLAAVLRDLLDRTSYREDTTGATTGRTDFALGPYQCDPASRTLTDRTSGHIIRLTEKEAAILACLRDATAPVSRDDLLSRVWGYANGVASHTLETHIHRLRRKIEANPRQPALLLKDGAGYRLER